MLSPLKILIIQAENCEDDICDFRDGIRRGIVEDGIATESEVDMGLSNVKILTLVTKVGREFADSVSQLLKA